MVSIIPGVEEGGAQLRCLEGRRGSSPEDQAQQLWKGHPCAH